MERYIADRIIENVHTAYNVFLAKVRTAIATVRNHRLSKAYMAMCEENGLATPSFSWLGEAGGKFRTSGIYNYFTNAYSLYGTNDLAQVTSTSQPYRTGDIARNERWGMKNPNGAANFMTHPTISFLSTDAWTFTFIANWNYDGVGYIHHSGTGNNSRIYMRSGSGAGQTTIGFTNSVGTTYAFPTNNTSLPLIGKYSIINLVSSGAGNLTLYQNGVLIATISAVTSFDFNKIWSNVGLNFSGSYHAHIIRPQALTQSQVTAEYNFFRALYPEIPSVVIGAQTWATSNCEMVCTPQGNLIAEIQAAANVAKTITNPNFDTGVTGWTIADFSTTYGWQWDGIGKAICNVPSGGRVIYQSLGINIGRFHKLTIDVQTTGTVLIYFGSNDPSPTTITTSGSYVIYRQMNNSTLSFYSGTQNSTIDNITLTEIGWSGSQELYDGIYAQTAGTVEQKTYAAVKAAAMWCHYNNDVALGAVYGKLYNWFAVKLMQMDIDYYNTANPSALWGWRTPTSTDFTTLSTTLGGDAVSGGKLKMTGLSYWNTPNTGADNSSGFSAIGVGRKGSDGASINLLNDCYINSINESGANNTCFILLATSQALSTASLQKFRGHSLRLIKA